MWCVAGERFVHRVQRVLTRGAAERAQRGHKRFGINFFFHEHSRKRLCQILPLLPLVASLLPPKFTRAWQFDFIPERSDGLLQYLHRRIGLPRAFPQTGLPALPWIWFTKSSGPNEFSRAVGHHVRSFTASISQGSNVGFCHQLAPRAPLRAFTSSCSPSEATHLCYLSLLPSPCPLSSFFFFSRSANINVLRIH